MNKKTIYSELTHEAKNKHSRTIFITAFFGFTGRNLLSNNMLDSLSKKLNSRIVIFLPDGKKELYQKLFASNNNVIIEGIKSKKTTKLEDFFNALFSYLSDVECFRMDLVTFRKNGQYLHALFFWILSKLGHLKIVRRIFRWADYTFMPKNKYKEYFEKYKKRFEENEVEIRPIISGNMVDQPFFKKYFPNQGPFPNASFIHENGFYCGNNPEMNPEEINFIKELLKYEKRN